MRSRNSGINTRRDEVVFLATDLVVPTTSVTARTAGLLAGNYLMLSAQAEKVAAEEAMAEEATRNG